MSSTSEDFAIVRRAELRQADASIAAHLSQPSQSDVDALREIFDSMRGFASNDQRARYLLTCDWMRARGARKP